MGSEGQRGVVLLYANAPREGAVGSGTAQPTPTGDDQALWNNAS